MATRVIEYMAIATDNNSLFGYHPRALNVTETSVPGVLVIEPKVFGDERGFFLESFNQRVFDQAVGEHVEFVQDNHSRSGHNVLRGLHYQVEYAQGKLVRVCVGEVFDAVVKRSTALPGAQIPPPERAVDPPKDPAFSMTRALSPKCAAVSAAVIPAAPLPATTTSTSSILEHVTVFPGDRAR